MLPSHVQKENVWIDLSVLLIWINIRDESGLRHLRRFGMKIRESRVNARRFMLTHWDLGDNPDCFPQICMIRNSANVKMSGLTHPQTLQTILPQRIIGRWQFS